MPTDSPSPSRAALGCLVSLASVAIPLTIAVVMPGPWWWGVSAGLVTTIATFVLGAKALGPLLKIDEAQPGSPPTPGPGDPVVYLDHVDQRRECISTHRHPPHWFFWRAEQPYLDEAGLPGYIPISGSTWCRGVRS